MNKLFMFALGAAAGSFLTLKILEEKYAKMLDTEIENIREYYKDNEEIIEKVEVSTEYVERPTIEVKEVKDTVKKKIDQKKPITYYYDKVQKMGYDITPEDHMSITEEPDGSIWVGPGEDYIDPYPISPDEFGEIESYDTKSWTYYSDSVITDDLGEIVYEPESIIGDNLIHFGEYEDDALHVRNENLECDYEIIKVEESFKELNRGKTDDVSPRS